MGNQFGFSVSHTSRQPRLGEVDGKDYFFVSKDTILADVEKSKFVEHALVHGNYYGTSVQAVEDVFSKNMTCLLDIDCQGAEQLKKSSLAQFARYLFIAPPSLETLEERLRSRLSDKEDAIIKRLANAKKEMEYMSRPGFFDKTLINDDLEEAYQELCNFAFESGSHGEKRSAEESNTGDGELSREEKLPSSPGEKRSANESNTGNDPKKQKLQAEEAIG